MFSNPYFSKYKKKSIFIWLVFAFQSGIINVGGFLACHRFVTHVTGFATFFGASSAKGKWLEALSMLIVPVFFLIGAMISGFLIDHQIDKNKKPFWNLTLFLLFILNTLVLLGGTTGFFQDFGKIESGFIEFILIALLCLMSGLQNASISTASRAHTENAVIRTSHLTGVTTDLGIGLVRMFFYSKKSDRRIQESEANSLRTKVILSFVLGSLVGAVTFMKLQYGGFALSWAISLFTFLLSLKFTTKARQK
jgi:uncharacterized membrane protein YoaK (UPF0700 family)